MKKTKDSESKSDKWDKPEFPKYTICIQVWCGSLKLQDDQFD